ncbi:Uncharacterised protein [Escherichia coli]|uniref:Uncharacterized protein n=1 Tax=Escherichia coli TaxID=562 RepID=A0A376RPL0_ECOLX|nr:Uncharacterised protein [Escherichia coli]
MQLLVRIGDGRDNFRIEVVFLTGDNFSGNVTFVNTFMCQHRLTDDIADSKDVRYVGTQLFVNADEPRSSTSTPALPASRFLPFGTRPIATSTAS